ncbi:head-tail connector protein [Variovorax sp. RCC_210]|uniref:head-tail connector protein n=1 Tax=Variovorax sp. RCC_210 TaxID=3239217 RepID=UPI003525A96A
MNPKIITKAAAVIDLARGKLQCKITGSDRDADVLDAIEAARDYAQEYLGQPVGEQVLEFTYYTWCGRVTLPCDVTELQTVSAAGAPVLPLPALKDRTLELVATAPVVIRIKCGWSAETLPGTVKAAMLLVIADLVRNPQAHTDVQLYKNQAFENMLWAHRERLSL